MLLLEPVIPMTMGDPINIPENPRPNDEDRLEIELLQPILGLHVVLVLGGVAFWS